MKTDAERTVEEAFAAFNQWVADNEEQVGELDMLEQIEAYYQWWSKLQ